jgi:hypothetical protein
MINTEITELKEDCSDRFIRVTYLPFLIILTICNVTASIGMLVSLICNDNK